ncbi:hypothetical protein D3C74_332590 [compost metagenome]
MNDDYIIFLRPGYHFTEKFRSCACACRVVRIVQVDQLRFAGNLFRNGIQVRQEVVFFLKLYSEHLSTQIFGVCAQHRITRNCHNGNVSRVNEAGWQHRQRRLRTNGVYHFSYRINAVYSKNFLKVSCGCGFELRNPVVGISTVFFFGGFYRELGNNTFVRHFIGFANAHINQLNIRKILFRRCFGAFDFLKFVDGCIFAIIRTADAVRKISLNESLLILFNAHNLCLISWLFLFLHQLNL